MKIKTATFTTSVANASKLLVDDHKQIAFVGRSNVGKSSLINMLVNHSKLCKTSSTPGRTRLVNYFEINKEFYFVDLPGYGYAKACAADVASWQSMIEPYLSNNPQLKCVCVLVDSRHDASPLDQQMIKYLYHYNVPFIIIATKVDKFAKSKIKPALMKLANGLNVGYSNIYGTSSSNAYGKEQVLDKLEQFLTFEPELDDDEDEDM